MWKKGEAKMSAKSPFPHRIFNKYSYIVTKILFEDSLSLFIVPHNEMSDNGGRLIDKESTVEG
jgi:hypothetical protein